MECTTQGTAEVAQGRALQGMARHQGDHPVHERICPRGPRRPPRLALMTLCGGISLPLAAGLVRPRPLFLLRRA
jgi:hypothetical protein